MKMNAIIVDDDRPAIEELEDALAEAGLVGKVEGYTRAAAGLEAIREERPDIVLLDIQMPGLTGLEAAAELRRAAPECAVVFVTAYAEHAIEAFGLAAVDYLLKPVDPKRLRQTLQRIWDRKRPRMESEAGPPAIRLFGSLKVAGPGGQVKWRTAKSGELFAYLYLRGEVAPERIIDDLFMDGKTDNAKAYLHTSIYQLRKSLAATGLSEQLSIAYDKHSYRLETNGMTSDVERFEQIAARHGDSKEELHEAVNLYGGELLEGLGNLWVVERREHDRRHFTAMAGRLAQLLEQEGALRQALEIVQKQHRHDPLNEALALHVARLYVDLGQHRLADDYVRRYMQRYREELDSSNSQVVDEYKRMLR
ncbi:response regulator [Paenibacillus daejeonensis]|uniref:response regulator n=1 Tax=Paenibacillus daejeonensis TaxID=135193 RepID=UPI0003645EC4|nr:response regulator [Paenibacillus daejeonensis]